MVIGAGFGQIPAINTAKELGLKVIAIDKNPKAEGMRIADFSYPVDVIDKKNALKIAKKHNISGVITMQSDLPVPTIGYLNDHLNLTGISLEVALACSNKVECRNRLAKFDCAQPKFQIIKEISEADQAVNKIGLPCVIKAPDSSGSRGVVKLKNKNDINTAFEEAKKYSRSGEIIVEEFVDGIEFGAQTFSLNGECKLVVLHNDTLSPPPYMIPVGHSFPFNKLNEEDEKIAKEDIKRAVEAIGINDGPANIDVILDRKTNRVKIIEIGARIGATCLPELVSYHTGINWVEKTILNCMNKPIDLRQTKRFPVAALILEAKQDGILKSFNHPTEKDYLVEFEVTAKIGDEVSKLRKGTDRIGKVICTGKSATDAEKNTEIIRDQMSIEVN